MLRILSLVTALLVLFVSGCSPSTSSDILRMPSHPKEYAEFNNELNKIRNEGASYAEPSSGANRQAIQLMDLDNDGVDEGIVFFRDSSNSYKVSLYIFKKNANDRFSVFDIIEGPSSDLQNVAYSDLLGKGNFEIIVGWGNDGEPNNILTVYSITEQGVELLKSTSFQHYIINDMDSDGINDLSVIWENQEKEKKITMYTSALDGLTEASETLLSKGIKTIERIRTGVLEGEVAGILLESTHMEQGLVTDLIVYSDKLINATVDDETGVSLSTMRKFPSFSEDVNNDGILEIPKPIRLSELESPALETVWGIIWQNYNPLENRFKDVTFTYHSYIDNWYIMMPVAWSGDLQIKYGGRRFGESSIEFYMNDGTEKLFTIYILTSDNKTELATIDDRFMIAEKGNTVYAAKIFIPKFMGTNIDEEYIKQAFRFRQNEWTMGENVF